MLVRILDRQCGQTGGMPLSRKDSFGNMGFRVLRFRLYGLGIRDSEFRHLGFRDSGLRV